MSTSYAPLGGPVTARSNKYSLVCLLVVSATLTFGLAACSDDGDGGSDEDAGESMAHDGSSALEPGPVGGTSGLTDDGTFFVSYVIDGMAMTGTTFSMTVSVFESDMETPVAAAELALTESMPSMGHGMNTSPEISSNGDGTFAVSNLEFSMAGDWEFAFTVTDGDRSDSIAFAYICCESM